MMILSKLYRSVSLWKCRIFMFHVEPATSSLAPLARRLRHRPVFLWEAAHHRGEERTLPSFHLGVMLGSAPRLRRRRAELVVLNQQAIYSGVTWGGDRGRVAHSPRCRIYLNTLHRWSSCPDPWNISPAGRSLPQRGGGAPVRWWDAVCRHCLDPWPQSDQAASHQGAGLLLLQDHHCCTKTWISIQSAMNFVIMIITGKDWLIFN